MIENHNDIVARCLQLDRISDDKGLIVYFLDCNRHTFRLGVSSMYWSHLAENERYCMVKYGNYFLNKEDAESAVARAMSK